jgi:PIN domain nuclease of toxin-antitoxin system
MGSSHAPIVVDASAVLAFLQEEKGYEQLADIITNALISAVNVAEVFSKLSDLGMPQHEQEAVLALLALEVVTFEKQGALLVGTLRAKTKTLGLSLGDRACISLGIERSATIYTTDKAWNKIPVEVLGKGCSIVCVR